MESGLPFVLIIVASTDIWSPILTSIPEGIVVVHLCEGKSSSPCIENTPLTYEPSLKVFNWSLTAICLLHSIIIVSLI